MHISRIEIQNIKSHVSSSFELACGTTAITGPNGAGKSTIVEAVAWVLFDLLEYKKEDFIRRGAKKGSVTVTFESGLDEREYTIFRDTGAAYHVIDPRLGLKIADKKEEVFRFLWQHLGLEPGTDLRSLFRQAIGVPQGTLTSIFLEGAVERKTAFDRLLKVEEYRQAAEKLRETSRFLDQSLASAREAIARSEGILTRHDELEAEHKTLVAQAGQITGEIEENRRTQTELQKKVDHLDVVEKKVAELRSQFEKLSSKFENASSIIERLKKELDEARIASVKVKEVRESASRHAEILGKLKELERERVERDALRAELSKVEFAIVRVEADRKLLSDDLKTIQEAHSELATVELKTQTQEEFESRLETLRNDAAVSRSAAVRLTAIDNDLERLRENYRLNASRISEVEELSGKADETDRLESRRSELMQHLAEIRATLERDERFQSEIKNGLCPVLSQKCLNLSAGQTLQGFITSQFTDVKAHIAELETERKVVEQSLVSARKAVQQLSTLDQYRRREVEIKEEGQRLRDERSTVEKRANELSEIEDAIRDIESKLRELDDPRSRMRSLQRQIDREPVVRASLSDAEGNLERLNSDRNTLSERMEPYTSLDENLAALSNERDATAEPYRLLLANEALAATYIERKEALKEAEDDHKKLEREVGDLRAALGEAGAGYDREMHDADRFRLRELENTYHSAKARLESIEERSKKMGREIAQLAEIRNSLKNDLQEKERLEITAEATAFIRDTLKEAAPRVARNYVYHVSLEANQLFREISGNLDQTLKWAEGYSVSLEEDGYDRPFISLSGGEQTAAALAIRLGLLKQLTDIRIAFFDEPTANMDADRRENLGQQLSRITHFDQLFVISHDDTFDSYVDHVISLG
jgi:DNA repair protein SbcC/Rad50